MMRSFEFGGQCFEVAGDAALYWSQQETLLVSDLHLEKASAYAIGGQMLPPYDSLATLEEISGLVRRFQPSRIISLGDNFHDCLGEVRLQGAAADLLVDLIRKTEWIWITGNHDPDVRGTWGGVSMDELKMGGVYLRHQSRAGVPDPEISGHYHPKFRQALRGRMVARRCFVRSRRKLIMPAFGALTGGLDVQDSVIVNACDLNDGEHAEALVPTRVGISRFVLASSGAFAK